MAGIINEEPVQDYILVFGTQDTFTENSSNIYYSLIIQLQQNLMDCG